jgi:hypothetical protein
MRFIRNLFLLVLFILIIGYFATNYALDKGTQEILSRAPLFLKGYGIKLDRFEYDSVRISSLRTVTWYNAKIRFRGSDKRYLDKDVEFELDIGKLNISLVDYSSTTVQISASNFTVVPTSKAVEALQLSNSKLVKGIRSGRVEGSVFEVSTAVDLHNPVASIKSIAQKIFDIAKKGSTTAEIRFEGKARMLIRGADLELKVLTKRTGGDVRFVLDRADIVRVSERFGDQLTPNEIKLLADNPMKAPMLFTIKDYAETEASRAYGYDNSVPEDPYRHVLWSYLLTKEFGAKFAKEITDAHEEGDTGNSSQERKQDYNNNAVGSKYAKKGVEEDKILQRVRTDPEVMRNWNRS